MKILQVVAYYPPALSFGGPPQVFYDLGRELVKRGHEVTVYTTDVLALDDWAKRIEAVDEVSGGVRIHRFRRIRAAGRLPTKYFKLYPSGVAGRFTESVSGFDIVHIAEITHPLAVKFSPAAARYGVPCVVSVFGNLTPDGNPSGQLLKTLFNILTGRRIMKEAASLLVQTSSEAKTCSRYVPESKIDTVVLPVDMSPFRSLPQKGGFRKKWGIGKEEKLLLFLGRVHRNKGIQFLVRAAASIMKKSDTKFRLVIAGTDEGYKETLEKLAVEAGIADRVVFTGGIFGGEKIGAYADATVFAITPCVYEETSLAALEACACGTPVIITERNAIPWLEDYHAGFQVRSGNQAELESALSKLLDDGELRKKMGGNARRLIEEKYALEKVAESLERVFMKVTGRNIPGIDRS